MKPGGGLTRQRARAGAAALAVLCASPASLAETAQTGVAAGLEHQLASLEQADAALKAVRASLPECEAGCITPDEATIMAFRAGTSSALPGRFLLDIKGGGQSLHGQLGQRLFVNSRPDYATLGTLTIAFEREALKALFQRASVCGGGADSYDQIRVEGCRASGIADLNMFTMMERLSGRRIVVDGEVRLQWIDSHIGSPSPVPNGRGERELGYYQVWVRVTDADQVIFVYEE